MQVDARGVARSRRSRRRVACVAGALLAASALGAACGFPDVTFAVSDLGGHEAGLDGTTADRTPPGTDGSPSEGEDGGPDAGADADADADARDPDAAPVIDGATPDVVVVEDDAGKVDAAGCASCDCDGDGANDYTKGGCNSGAQDCDDQDKRASPFSGFRDDPAEPTRNGDWDCNGTTDKGYREDINCSKINISLLGGVPCEQIFGFSEPVPCGQVGTLHRCKTPPGLPLNCQEGPSEQVKQACR